MKTKTSELTGPALDWAVAKALGWIDYPTDSIEKGRYWHTDPNKAPWGERISKLHWSPSVDRNQGGLIIERERISVVFKDCIYPDEHRCFATSDQDYRDPNTGEYGPTPLIAAMRCYVAFKLGEEVDIPEELL